MRALVLVLPLLLLGGCESLFYLDSDDFQIGKGSYEVFVEDNRICTKKADDFVSYNILGMGGSSYHRHRAFNRVYADCMIAYGHPPRAWTSRLIR